MKLLLLVALVFSVALVRAQETGGIDLDIVSEDDGLNGDFDDSDGAGISIESTESDDEDDEDEDDYDEDEDDYDEDEDDYDEDEDDYDEDEDEIEIRPTTGYRPTRKRWLGFKCMVNVRKCLMNATDCEEHLACYEQKSACWKTAKKEQKPFMKKSPRKMICKTKFNKCMERAGSDCFKKYMCYRKKGFCYRSRKGGHRRPCHGHHRRRPHPHRPTMNPEMLKCKMQWRACFMDANSCSERLKCMFDFHACMNRSRPTGPPPTMSPEDDEENMNVYKRRWNPELMAKCKKEFHECIENASSSCPLKMRCFWRMKMCFKPHHRPHHGYKKKMMVLKITKLGGQRNRGMGSRYGQTGREWGSRGMGSSYGQTGREWGNRGMGSRYGQTGREWGNRGMGSSYGQTGREWGSRGMGSRYGQTGRQWIKRGMGVHNRQTGRQRAKKFFKPIQSIEKKFKNFWNRNIG